MGRDAGVRPTIRLVCATLTALVPALVLVLFLSWTTVAHRPLFAGAEASDPESAPRLSNPSVSRVIYYELDDRGDVQWFVIENDRPRVVPVQLGVPVGSPLESADPVIILFGPGLDDRMTGVEIDPPRGTSSGARVLSRSGHPKPFYEPVTGTDSLILVDTSVQLPSSGSYYGAVFDAGGREGKVWVGVGRREGFTWRDIGRLPGWMREVRDFHEVPGWPRWMWIAGTVLAVAVAAGLAWLMRGKMRSDPN